MNVKTTVRNRSFVAAVVLMAPLAGTARQAQSPQPVFPSRVDLVTVDVAVLDVNLNGRMSYPVADMLKSRGVPFLFATGYGAKILVPPHNGTPTLQKPFKIDDLQRMLERLAVA